ncbi:MAG TPA: DUF3416 domain-containing protein, partial [Opitutales bacterium]|nr:DUF3416 domain-containing protein [Opitutales bacterium]
MSDPADIAQFRGQSRVIIDKLAPCIDGGLFPAKRVEGEKIKVDAHIFTDGHDSISAVLQYRKRGEEVWSETAFTELPNDEWEASFTPSGIGFFEYRVLAWVDHFRFWSEGFAKKLKEGQKMSVELRIGSHLAAEAASRAQGVDAERLEAISRD